jgi:hypothetical protein
MGRAKEIVVKVIPANIANEFVKKHHYSGKVVPNSQLHFGAFLDNALHGVMSFGASINKKGTINLVKNTGWNDFLELNRMAFDEYLPKNSESRCISIALKLIKKNAPNIKWVISFADGCSCGDGTIYRASGFLLTDIRENKALKINPITKEKVHTITAYHQKNKDFKKWEALDGYQLRYIYFIDKSKQKDLTVPIIPFSKIDELGAGMYKGEKITQKERHNKKQPE